VDAWAVKIDNLEKELSEIQIRHKDELAKVDKELENIPLFKEQIEKQGGKIK